MSNPLDERSIGLRWFEDRYCQFCCQDGKKVVKVLASTAQICTECITRFYNILCPGKGQFFVVSNIEGNWATYKRIEDAEQLASDRVKTGSGQQTIVQIVAHVKRKPPIDPEIIVERV